LRIATIIIITESKLFAQINSNTAKPNMEKQFLGKTISWQPKCLFYIRDVYRLYTLNSFKPNAYNHNYQLQSHNVIAT